MTIIAGTDGTDWGMTAVEWAAAEAQRRHTPLRIVHASDGEWHESRFATGARYAGVARELADAVVADARDRACEIAPGLEITTGTRIGPATPCLLEAAKDAELLVLGSRGGGGFAGLRLGSVSQRVATHAPCPVVVVPGRDVPSGPVAVGLGDSPAAEPVLAAAFDAAAGRGCGLTIVRSLAEAIPSWLAEFRRADIPAPEERTAELDRIEEQLRPWRDKYPDVAAEVVLAHDTAASSLVRASHSAQLAVVGRRGDGAIGGALLGSAGLQLLHHAACPVLIARA